MSLVLALVIGAAAAAAPDPQNKEAPIGTRIPRSDDSDWNAFAQPEVRKVQKAFAECVVKKRRGDAERFVLEQSPDARKPLIAKVADGNCLVAATQIGPYSMVKMQFTGDFMKYALADALVRLEYGVAPITDFAAVAPLQHEQPDLAKFTPPPGKKLKPAQLQSLEESKNTALGYAYLAQFGECVVRANPSAAYRLLMSAPTTPEETVAFAEVTPAARNCLEVGRTLALNKATLRGTVAYNYFRLAKAPRAVQPQAVGASK
jgi:hypothetical protein